VLLGARLARVAGALGEVPVMLSVCKVCTASKHWFDHAPRAQKAVAHV